MPDTAFYDLVLANLSTSSHNILPHSQCPSHTGSQGLRTLEALFCLRASAHTSACFLFPLCFFPCFTYVIFSESLSLTTLSKGNSP